MIITRSWRSRVYLRVTRSSTPRDWNRSRRGCEQPILSTVAGQDRATAVRIIGAPPSLARAENTDINRRGELIIPGERAEVATSSRAFLRVARNQRGGCGSPVSGIITGRRVGPSPRRSPARRRRSSRTYELVCRRARCRRARTYPRFNISMLTVRPSARVPLPVLAPVADDGDIDHR